MNMIIIDSSSEKLLVIAYSNGNLAVKNSINTQKRHNSILLPFIDDALSDLGLNIKGVDYIACVVGAGSFTGIRLGVTTANALAKGIGAKLISMNAFEVLAYNVRGKSLALVDAKHNNFYGGIYQNGKEIELGNYDLDFVEAFDGNVIVRDDNFDVEKYVEVALSKKEEAVDYLIPLYLKKSQAERELECK